MNERSNKALVLLLSSGDSLLLHRMQVMQKKQVKQTAQMTKQPPCGKKVEKRQLQLLKVMTVQAIKKDLFALHKKTTTRNFYATSMSCVLSNLFKKNVDYWTDVSAIYTLCELLIVYNVCFRSWL